MVAIAVELATAYVSVVPSFKGAQAAIKTGLADPLKKEADRAEKAAGASFSRISARAQLAAAAGAAIFLKGAFREFEEAEKVTGRTVAVLKSTGGAANVSQKQVEGLAKSISGTAAVDDELVQSAENILLTFRNIKNAGTDKVFDRTTRAVFDMSAALGQDAQSSAIQLGKALQRPVEGLSALQRVGITFTAQQKEQIKNFVEMGDTAKAQGVILAEVEAEFGGAAEASATDADKAKVAFGNLQESVGTALVPAFTAAAKVVTVLSEAFSAQPGALQQIELGAIAAGVGYAKLKGPLSDTYALAKKAIGRFIALTAATVAEGVAAEGAAVANTANAGAITAEGVAATGTTSKLGLLAAGFGAVAIAAAAVAVATSGGDQARPRVLEDSDIAQIVKAKNAYKALKDVTAGGFDLRLTDLDKPLADLVRSGNAVTAKKVLSEVLAVSGSKPSKELLSVLKDYNVALGETPKKAHDAASGVEEIAPAAAHAAERLGAFNSALDTYLGKTLGAEQASDAFQGAINAEAAAVLAAGGHFADTSDQAIAFRVAQDELVKSAGNVLTAMVNEDATAEQLARRQKQLADQYYLTAIANGVPAEVARKYAEIIRNIPAEAHTTIFLDTDEAIRKLTDLSRRIGAGTGFDSAAFVQANQSGRASGGPVVAGRPYIVGERRPELFVPKQDGTIVPQVPASFGKTGGAVVNIENQNIYDPTDVDVVVKHLGFLLATA